MPGHPRLTIAQLLFSLIFVLALFVRLFDLGSAPLSDGEAQAALQAYALLPGTGADEAGVWPGYAALTGLLFFAFGDSNFIARLAPALAGAALVWAPYILRGRIGQGTALVFSFALAIDPVFSGLSRLAGGPLMGLSFLGLALALRAGNHGRHARVAAAALAGLALLSGPAVFLGILGLVFAWVAARAFAGIEQRDVDEYAAPPEPIISRAEVLAFGLTLLLAGTLFLRVPAGFGSLAASIPAFLAGWVRPSGVPVANSLIALFSYHGLVLVFALVEAWRSWRSPLSGLGRLLSLWFATALLLALLFPGREVADLAWALLPAWGLAAAGFVRSLRPGVALQRPALLAAVLIVLLVGFWNNLTGLSYAPVGDAQFTLRLLVIAGTLILAVLSVALVYLGWDASSASAGTVWGLAALVVMGLIAGNWGASHRDAPAMRELWLPAPLAGQEKALQDTLSSLGSWTAGHATALDIAVSEDSPSLHWALRRFPDVRVGDTFAGGEFPSVILTAAGEQDLRLGSAYRGQGILWRVYPQWGQMTGLDWLRWLLFRQAPATTEEIILWARADLFLSGDDVDVDAFPLDSLEIEPDEDVIPLEDIDELLPGN